MIVYLTKHAIKIMTLNNEESILEQLSYGNKAQSLACYIIIDLVKHTKEEKYKAEFAKVMLPDGEAPYKEQAEKWWNEYKNDYTTITIKGKQGQVASLPYERKNDLEKIIRLFNT